MSFKEKKTLEMQSSQAVRLGTAYTNVKEKKVRKTKVSKIKKNLRFNKKNK